MWNRKALATILFVCLGAAAMARAQCELEWSHLPAVPGVNGAIQKMANWDPDGSGPLPPKLVAAGDFEFAGGITARGMASLDYASKTWSPLGSGLLGTKRCMVAIPGGDLLVGGVLSIDGGATHQQLVRWDGSTWSSVATFTNGVFQTWVYAAALADNGDLIVAGEFGSVGGVLANNVARFDGTSWSALGSGTDDRVYQLAAAPNGDIFASGRFANAGGSAIAGIARWDGQSWYALGAGVGPIDVHSLLVLPQGDLLVGGDFAMVASVNAQNIARWNGSSWSALGVGTEFAPETLVQDANGDVLAGGYYAPGLPTGMNCVARWNGSSWSPLGTGMNGRIWVWGIVEAPDSSLWIGGGFYSVNGRGAMNLVRWDGTTWSALGDGIGGYSIRDTKIMASGDLLVAGDFTLADSTSRNVARWNGSSWSGYGPDLQDNVISVAEMANGDIVAGGYFHTSTGSTADYVARWDGANWTTLGSTIDRAPQHLCALPNGDLIAVGNFAGYIARWNGTAWTTLGGGLSGPADALLLTPYGGCLVAGKFQTAGTTTCNGIALWTGFQWLPLGAGLTTNPNQRVGLLANAPGDAIVAAGSYGNGHPWSTSISYWDWSSWQTMAAQDTVAAMITLPNSDLLVAELTGAFAAGTLSRWNGSSWSGLTWPSRPYFTIPELAQLPDGSVAVTTANAGVVKILKTTCPALATPIASGCSGTGGHNELVALTLPWIQSELRTEGRGLAAQSLALELNGLSPTSIPFASILPEGGTGCVLLTLADTVRLHVPSSNTLQTTTPIPSSIALVGGTWHQQLVFLEFAPSGDLALVTSTNALRLEIGSF